MVPFETAPAVDVWRIFSGLERSFRDRRVDFKYFERVLKPTKESKVLTMLSALRSGKKVSLSFRELFSFFFSVMRDPEYKRARRDLNWAALVRRIVREILKAPVCVVCGSGQISVHKYHLSYERAVYFCQRCNQNVRVSHRLDFLPVFLAYLDKFLRKATPAEREGKTEGSLDGDARSFVRAMVDDAWSVVSQSGGFQDLKDLHEFCVVNLIPLPLDDEQLASLVKRFVVSSVKKGKFEMFEAAKDFSRQVLGVDPILDSPTLKKAAMQVVLRRLREGLPERALETMRYLRREAILAGDEFKDDPEVEAALYEGLAESIPSGNSMAWDTRQFERMLDLSAELGYHVDVQRIPNRLHLVTEMLLNCIDSLGSIENLFPGIKFACRFDLFARELDKQEKKVAKAIRRNPLYMAVLHDLFGPISDAGTVFLFQDFPLRLRRLFVEQAYPLAFGVSPRNIGHSLKSLLNNYSFYGLNVKNIGTVRDFLRHVDSELIFSSQPEFLRTRFAGKDHVVSLKNLERIREWTSLRPRPYEFPIVSMVVRAGLGPQGRGFTYATPFGELIEICSDVEENQAHVIQFKKFIKRTFLKRLERGLHSFHQTPEAIRGTIEYFDSRLPTSGFVHSDDVEATLDQMAQYLREEVISGGPKNVPANEVDDFVELVRRVARRILVPVRMEDQFKVRMDLVAKGVVLPSEVAKLTSLKDRSHYDILSQRVFLQMLVEAFIRIS
ncbi:MAG: hypothetical protein Kow0069_00350 [Promethearchaeota archaeon]